MFVMGDACSYLRMCGEEFEQEMKLRRRTCKYKEEGRVRPRIDQPIYVPREGKDGAGPVCIYGSSILTSGVVYEGALATAGAHA